MLSDLEYYQKQQLEVILNLRECLISLVGESFLSQFGCKSDGVVGEVFTQNFAENATEEDSVNAAWDAIAKSGDLLDFYGIKK